MKGVAAVLAFVALAVLLAPPPPVAAGPKVAVIAVKGMVCQAWPFSVKTALERLPGVARAEVSLERAEARVEFDDSKISADQLAAAIDRIGFQGRVLRVTEARGGSWRRPGRRPPMVIELLTAPGWGKCQAATAVAREVIDSVRAARPDVELRVVDVTQAPEAAIRHGVRATPATVVDGRLVFTGVPSAQALRAAILERPG